MNLRVNWTPVLILRHVFCPLSTSLQKAGGEQPELFRGG